MLLKRHYLDGVITEILDVRQHIAPELIKCSDLLLFGAHTYMAFIYKRVLSLPRPAVPPSVRLSRIPDLRTERLGLRILHRPRHIGGKTFSPASGPFYVKLVQSPVGQEHSRDDNLPVAVADRMHGVCLRPLPVVEIADYIDLRSVGSPLPEHPVPISVVMKSVIEMVVDPPGQGPID